LDISNILSPKMALTSYPDEQDIRAALVRRAEEFSRKTGISKTEIGKRAVNDGAFIGQVAEGRNFTIRLYCRLMHWLDENWPAPEPSHTRARNLRRHRAGPKISDSSKRNDRNDASVRTPIAAGHFSRFKHLRRDHFRSAAEIEAHIRKLRDEWSHR
jgi:hypothetical protein